MQQEAARDRVASEVRFAGIIDGVTQRHDAQIKDTQQGMTAMLGMIQQMQQGMQQMQQGMLTLFAQQQSMQQMAGF